MAIASEILNRYSNNSVSGFVVRDSITREREDFEGDIEGMVGAIAQHVLKNLAAQHSGADNKKKWTFQMEDGEVRKNWPAHLRQMFP